MSAYATERPGRKAKPDPPRPAFIHIAMELREHIALLGADQVAELLRVRVADLEPMLAGRVRPLSIGMRRLRALAQ